MDARTGKRRSLVLLLLVLAVAAASVLFAERFHARLDLTADGSYSLSPVSKGLYKEIPERLRITYYRSPALAARHPGPRAVEDFLREFEAAGRGRITLAVRDPSEAGGPGAGAVEALGVLPQRMQVVERSEQRVAVVYSGIVLEYLGRTEAIPFVLGAESLEYGLVKAARRVVQGRKPVAAVLVGDADKSFETDYRSVSEALSASGWAVQSLLPGDEPPPGTDVLLVLGNSGLDDYAAYRVDAYLAGGGSAVFAVRGVDVEARERLSAKPLADDAILESLAAYGVKVGRSLVLDRSSLTVPFQEQNPAGGSAYRYVRYPHWIAVRPENADGKHPVTSRLSGLDLFWPSPLELSPPSGVAAEPLVRTTPKAWLQTKDFAIAPEEEAYFAREEEATRGQYLLAATLSGRLPMAYAGREIPVREGATPLPPLPAEAKPSRILVVGSADFANDLMTMTDSLFNAAFVAGGAEWLSSGSELAALKSRGGRDPRLSRIEDPEERNLAALFAYAVNLVLVPGGLAVYGLVRARKRKAEARRKGEAAAPGTEAPAAAAAPHSTAVATAAPAGLADTAAASPGPADMAAGLGDGAGQEGGKR